jgi:Short C-terminal domain
MPLRRRRPIARVATTAVVAGTAANMGAKSAQRSAAAAQAQDAPPAPAPAAEPAAPEAVAPEAAAPEAAAPEAISSEQIEMLKQLAALKDQGILTEEEFAAKKAQILGL